MSFASSKRSSSINNFARSMARSTRPGSEASKSSIRRSVKSRKTWVGVAVTTPGRVNAFAKNRARTASAMRCVAARR
jgi:hypothetical protein